MILIIGGIASGKSTFARSLGFTAHDVTDARADELFASASESDLPHLVDLLAEKRLVLCTEVGSGLVPPSARERAARERVGRGCATLAARADSVVRMVCGIPCVLKGDPWNSC